MRERKLDEKSNEREGGWERRREKEEKEKKEERGDIDIHTYIHTFVQTNRQTNTNFERVDIFRQTKYSRYCCTFHKFWHQPPGRKIMGQRQNLESILKPSSSVTDFIRPAYDTTATDRGSSPSGVSTEREMRLETGYYQRSSQQCRKVFDCYNGVV